MHANPFLRHISSLAVAPCSELAILAHANALSSFRPGSGPHLTSRISYLTFKDNSMPAPQSFKSHTRWDPLFHFFIMPLLLANVIVVGVCIVRSHQHFGFHAIWSILIAVVLLLLAFKARTYALQVQDRVIRLEEKSRLASLVSASELIELESLTMRQYIGLRFASNPELPDLARRAIREKLTERQIKEAISSWRADNDRV